MSAAGSRKTAVWPASTAAICFDVIQPLTLLRAANIEHNKNKCKAKSAEELLSPTLKHPARRLPPTKPRNEAGANGGYQLIA